MIPIAPLMLKNICEHKRSEHIADILQHKRRDLADGPSSHLRHRGLPDVDVPQHTKIRRDECAQPDYGIVQRDSPERQDEQDQDEGDHIRLRVGIEILSTM